MPKYVFALPNILTYARVMAVPIVVACFFIHGSLSLEKNARYTAAGIFFLASVTDFFDGYLARIWQQSSALGRLLDPIADKLLVSACLLLLVADRTITEWNLWAAIIILCREILVSGLREYLAEVKVSIPVSRLAKWKTAAQMFSLLFLLIGSAVPVSFSVIIVSGLALLWIAALLTLVTGYDYVRHGLSYVTL